MSKRTSCGESSCFNDLNGTDYGMTFSSNSNFYYETCAISELCASQACSMVPQVRTAREILGNAQFRLRMHLFATLEVHGWV